MGRPAKDIGADQVRKLAKLGCTQDEIADFFGCAHSVITERFGQEFHLGRGESKISLRRMQWKAARAGSVAMLVHLGKVQLDQTDRLDVTNKGGTTQVVLVERADNPRDAELDGWARQRVRALDDRLERQNKTVIEMPYKDGEAVPRKESDLAPSLPSPEARQVKPDL
jgi:hypothetical protein